MAAALEAKLGRCNRLHAPQPGVAAAHAATASSAYAPWTTQASTGMNTTMRPTEQRMGGLTVEEQAAIGALMAPYRREWGDSPVLRQYGRIPHSEAPAVASRTFELAGGKL